MTRRLLRRLRADTRGVTIVEFAFVAPVMLVGILGFSDLAYQGYAQAMLEGAVQKAARDSTLEGGGTKNAEIDARVLETVRGIAGKATLTSTRKSYESFTNVRPEKFTDTNGNKIRDVGECYDDVNNNKNWDVDPGKTGQGGADDVVVYEVKLRYPRVFPALRMQNWSLYTGDRIQEISAKTIIKNQPFAAQSISTVVSRCE